MTTNRLSTPIGQLTPEPITTPIALPSQSRSVTRSVQASHGRTDGRTDEELGYLASESSRNASPAGGLKESTIPGQPGDVVRLDTDEICGFMPGDIVNPWVLLNDLDANGDGIFYEAEYVEAHAPVLLVRDTRPVDAVSPPAPVVRPVGSGAARGDLAPSINTYGGDETRGVRSVQHWQLRFGDHFVADTSGPETVAVWQAVIDERASLLAEVERLRQFDATSKARFAELRRQYLAYLAEARAETATRRAERDAARSKVRAAELLHVWTNEDGRRFVFVDDLAQTLGIPS